MGKMGQATEETTRKDGCSQDTSLRAGYIGLWTCTQEKVVTWRGFQTSKKGNLEGTLVSSPISRT